MNLLFIATESKSANGICCKAVMEQFIAAGDTVYCITNSEYTDIPRAKQVNYVTVKPRLSYRLFGKADTQTGVAQKTTLFFAKVTNKAKLLISFRTWPLISKAYVKRLYKVAEKICKSEKIDCIIPIYTQIDTLIVAKKIKDEFPKIKYVPYFLDALAGGYGPKVLSQEWTNKRCTKWENKLLPTADKIIMMKSAESYHIAHFSKSSFFRKIVFLDLPLYNPLKTGEVMASALFEKDKINLLYIGTIPVHIRNPKYFLTVFSALKGNALRLHIVGSCTDPELLQRFEEKDNRIKVHQSVSHEEALTLIQNADYLINFGNNNSHMTPCKIFEYMSFGKPIISVSPIKNEPSEVYLSKYPDALIVKEYEKQFERDVESVEAFLSNKRYIADDYLSELQKTFYLNTPNAFINEIKK